MESRRDFLGRAGAIGTIGAAAAVAPFLTLPAGAEETVGVALFGDYGVDSPGQDAVARMVDRWQPDAVFTLGDNVYSADDVDPYEVLPRKALRFYQRFVDAGTFFPALGNHDWGDPGTPLLSSDGNGGTRGAWHDLMTLPGNGRYYDVRIGPLHVFVLDDYYLEPDGNKAGSKQAEWLRTTAAASNAVWKIVTHHYPPYASPLGGKASIRWPFEQWGIDASFAGHWHHYERIEKDILYFVNGLGGAPFGFSGNPIPGSKKRVADKNGAIRLTASASRMTIEFVDTSGRVRDTVSRFVGSTPAPSAPAQPAQPEPPMPEPAPTGSLVDEPYRSMTGRDATLVRLYLAAFDRAPDSSGFSYWRSLRIHLIDIASYFAASAEFRNRYGTLTNGAFVERVYLNVLGRGPDAKGARYWTGLLEDGIDRADVLIGFSESLEFKRRTGILG
ncbi:MAG: DUF4214 domain-containing protein [Acidimicrobiales bacterium]|nr:DUF4214 domain-containing protein [Acidimicrobiales bacterium]